MRRVHPFTSRFFGSFLATLVLASPVLAEVTLHSAVKFEKSIHFQKPDGEPIQFPPGIYQIERGSANQLKVVPTQSKDAIPIAIQAIPANHEQPIEYVRALLTPAPDNNEDRMHILLWEPNGVASEAIGSYSGVFSRSTLTWGTQPDDDSDALSSITFADPIYFRTKDGGPEVIKPGEYDVIVAGTGVRLVKVEEGGEGSDGIVLETSPLDHATAALLPKFDGNPNLSLLLIASADGRPLVAMGSDDGTYSRGAKERRAKRKAKRKARRERMKKRAKKIFAKAGKAAKVAGRVGVKALKWGAKRCAENPKACAKLAKMAAAS